MIGCKNCAEQCEQGLVNADQPCCYTHGGTCVRYLSLTIDGRPINTSPEHFVPTLRQCLIDARDMAMAFVLMTAHVLPFCVGKRYHSWCMCCSPMTCVRCGRKDPWS